MGDLTEMRAKWERYGVLLSEPEREGSMLGRAFIIARSGVTDVLALLDELNRLHEVERCAAGLVRTSGVHWQSAEIQVVRQWWDALKSALGPDGG